MKTLDKYIMITISIILSIGSLVSSILFPNESLFVLGVILAIIYAIFIIFHLILLAPLIIGLRLLYNLTERLFKELKRKSIILFTIAHLLMPTVALIIAYVIIPSLIAMMLNPGISIYEGYVLIYSK